MFHLQTGIDLQESEQFVTGVIQEFDGGGTGVTDGDGEPFGRFLELGDLLGPQHDRRGFLDHLLVAPLNGTVAHTECPGGALAVGDHLHFDVASAGHHPFEEHDAAAERACGFLTSALVCLDQVAFLGDDADTAPTTTRGGLQHHRVADGGCRGDGVFEGVDGATAPRSDRYAHRFGDLLAADLVAEFAHRIRARTDEGDPDLCAQFGEGRVFGDETPTDPSGFGASGDEGLLQGLEIDVRPSRCRAEVVGDVGFAHERGVAVDVGVERDRFDRLAGLGREVAHGVYQSHGCLATVHDGDSAEHRLLAPFTKSSGGDLPGTDMARGM